MTEPAVSVIVPTRNRWRLLATTLAAIFDQTEEDLDVIVVDEASVDDTAERLRHLDDPRLRVLRHEVPQGVARARNRGMAVARGAWLALCDDDDIWAPDKLARQLEAAQAAGRDWALGGALWFEDAGAAVARPSPSSDDIMRRLPFANPVPGGCSNVIGRRELFRATGGFDPRLRLLADWDLWIRLARSGPPAVVDRPLLAYRLHGGNMSTSTRGVSDELRILEEKTVDLRTNPLDGAWVYGWLGHAALRAGRRRQAASAFARAASWRDARSILRFAAALSLPPAMWQAAPLSRRRRPEPPPPWLTDLLRGEADKRPGTRRSLTDQR